MNTSGFFHDGHGFNVLDLSAKLAFKSETSISFPLHRPPNGKKMPDTCCPLSNLSRSAQYQFVFLGSGFRREERRGPFSKVCIG